MRSIKAQSSKQTRRGIPQIATVKQWVSKHRADRKAAQVPAQRHAIQQVPSVPHDQQTASHDPSSDVRHIARRLKEQLSKAAKRLFADGTTHSLGVKPLFSLEEPTLESSSSLEDNNNSNSNNDSSSSNNSNNDNNNNNTVQHFRLNNLQLLKQYLTAVAQECDAAVTINQTPDGNHAVQLEAPCYRQEKDVLENERQKRKTAGAAAKLIETLVNDDASSLMHSVIDSPSSHRYSASGDQHLPLPTSSYKTSGDSSTAALPISVSRARPLARRPHARAQRQKVDILENARRSRRKRNKNHMAWLSKADTFEESSIRCICSFHDEEFGFMVQCDDCSNWLHMDCLELTEQDLGESFRCPHCYLELGPSEHIKLISNVTWRFAAHHASKQLADAYHNTVNDNESDTEEAVATVPTAAAVPAPQPPSTTITASAAAAVESTVPTVPTNVAASYTPPIPSPSYGSSPDSMDVDMIPPRDNTRRVSEGTVSLVDDRSESVPISDLTSEVSTPENNAFYCNDPYNLYPPTVNYFQQGLEATIAQLFQQMIYPAQNSVFLPQASDVFLCDGSSSASSSRPTFTATKATKSFTSTATASNTTISTSSTATRSSSGLSSDTLPSSLCPGDLRQYSFEYSPFWPRQQ